MARSLVLTAYAKPSEKQMLEELAGSMKRSHSEVIIEALRQLHAQLFKVENS